MKKILTVIVLLLIIMVTAAFSGLYVAFNLSDPDNQINLSLRKHVLTYPVLRKLLRLEQVGDARFDYARQPSMPVTIYVYYQNGVSLESGVVDTFIGEISPVIRKTVREARTTPEILTDVPDKINDAEVDRLAAAYGSDGPPLSKEVPLTVLVLKYYTDHPSYAGLAVNAHTIILFETAMENVSDTPEILAEVQTSTLLHEFGHLLGADHIQATGCVMEDTVENLNFYRKLTGAHDSYCAEDYEVIRQALTL